MTTKAFFVLLVLTGSILAQTAAQDSAASGKRPFTFENMMALKRLSDPVPSPDGKWVVSGEAVGNNKITR